MLDAEHDGPSEVSPGDDNSYQLGSIGKHNVVIAILPLGSYGTTSATVVATQMKSTFRSLKVYLMVGIGGGIPKPSHDIRLGDIVVSKPENGFGGVVQYDLGKTVNGGRFERSGSLNKPPQILLTAIASLKSQHELKGRNNVPDYLSEVYQKHPGLTEGYTYQGEENDTLYKAHYEHEGNNTCDSCNTEEAVLRKIRKNNYPVVHYGTIASGNQVMKHGTTRDYIGDDSGAICFEMEAAGLMDHFPCLVIRGICDYSDSHKNKRWQPYAALTAAAYAKELLSQITPLVQAGSPGEPHRIVEQRIFDIPRILHPHFSGRQKYLQQIYNFFHRHPTSEEGGIVSIFGMPGVGKSQLSLKYVMENKKGYNFGFYSIAKTVDHWFSSCNNIVQALKLPEAGSNDQDQRTQALKRWFASKADWILIIDDVASSVVELLRSSLPQDLNGHIIISTRDKHIAHEFSPPEGCFHLQEMDSTEGKDLVLKVSGREGDTGEIAEKISRELGGLPLALEQSVRCAVQRCWDLSMLFENLQEGKLGVVQDPIDNPHHTDVITTLDIALKELDPVHTNILNLILMMRPQALPVGLLIDGAPSLAYSDTSGDIPNITKKYRGNIDSTSKTKSKDWSKRFRNQFKGLTFMKSKSQTDCVEPKDENSTHKMDFQNFQRMKDVLQSKSELNKAILVLERSSIVRRSKNGNIWVHDLFREVLQSKVKESDRRKYAQYTAEITCQGFPHPSDPGTWPICSSYLPHILEVMALLGKYNMHNQTTISTMSNIGYYYYNVGRTNEALQWSQKLLQISENTLGIDHRESCLIMIQVGIGYQELGRSDEALQIYNRTLVGLTGVKFLQYARSRPISANFPIKRPRDGKTEALQLCQSVLGTINCDEDHKRCPEWEKVFEVIYNIAALSSQIPESIDVFQQLFTTQTKLLGKENPLTLLTSVGLIGALLRAKDHGNAASELFDQVFPSLIKVMGGNHRSTMYAIYYKGKALVEQRSYAEARQFCEILLERAGRIYGKSHILTFESFGLLAAILEGEGDDEEAMVYFERAYSGFEKILGKEYDETLEIAASIEFLRNKLDTSNV
ncbi:hypothetical protein TWF506_010739 [Arthrobotrys conoides]|uniref:NB-ARC domain-containing protein n=1 Tax=Arthrobotrys conoides TaxID=74498 RepID=A0AAN8N224_9PEZI